jgi:hypothetical protein
MPTSPPERAPLRAALIAQLGGVIMVVLLVVAITRLTQVNLWQIPLVLALLQGGLSAMIAFRQRAPRWWLPIHLGFMPLAVIVQGFGIAPIWFLAAFVLLLLVFWRTDKSRVPLYLTNRDTATALLDHLPAGPGRIIDLGCGDGGLLRRLALARPECTFVGIEHAPLTWLVAWLRTLRLTNACVRRGDFWCEPLGSYALVYAFLSPAPMLRLWEKACAEMAPDALLASNSFVVPNVAPLTVVAVGDRRATRLYLYQPSRQADKGRDSAAFPAIPPGPNQE